jgi:hypothetical protein
MSNLHFAFLTGFLLRTPSATSIADLCQVSKSTAATALTSQTFRRVDHIVERASVAASTVDFAFDYTQSHNTGSEMQGLSYTYLSSHQKSKLGQCYASMALVHSRELPVPIRLTYAVSRELETERYLYLTPSEHLIQATTAVKAQGIHFKGTMVDAEFGNKKVVGHFVTHNAL